MSSRIENPDGGDTMCQWSPISNGYSENFASPNRNKRSVVLDLKNVDDNKRARALIMSADVVSENNRPGVMERLGLHHKAANIDKPDLV